MAAKRQSMIALPPSVSRTNRRHGGGSTLSAPSCWSRRSVCFRPIGLTSTGIGNGCAQPVDPLVGGDHRDAVVGGAGHDLLAEQGASPPLDHPELGVDLVGTIEVDVQRVDVVQLAEGDVQAAGELGGRQAGRNRDDLQTLPLDPFAEVLDHQGRRRARSESDDHPALNQGSRGMSSAKLGGIGV